MYNNNWYHPQPPHRVRPQSAMGLTSPTTNAVANSQVGYHHPTQSPPRPPSSLGKRTMHQQSRSFGDGTTSEQVFVDGILPQRNNLNRGLPNKPSLPTPEFKRNQMSEQTKPPMTPKMHFSVPQASYNAYDESNINVRIESEHHHSDNKPTHSRNLSNSQDLRSAWQRLYGPSAESSPRRHSQDHTLMQNIPNVKMDESAIHQTAIMRSPHLSLEIRRNHALQSSSHGKNVAGPMVAPLSGSGRQSPPGQCATSQNVTTPPLNIRKEPQTLSPTPAVRRNHPMISHNLGPAAKYPDHFKGHGKQLPTDLHNSSHDIIQNDYADTHFIAKSAGHASPMPTYHARKTQFRQDQQVVHSSNNIMAENEEGFQSESDEEFQLGHLRASKDYGYPHDIKVHNRPHSSLAKHASNSPGKRKVVRVQDRTPEPNQTQYERSRSLEDVRGSGDESDLSFDVENTFLMVDPSDMSESGTLKSKQSDVRTKLDRIEGMYTQVMKTLQNKNPKETRSRRWSIGSSDTNSLRHQVHRFKRGHSSSKQMEGRDMKTVNKRFQRLESHVITLARSIAHISSELRTQTTMSREIENVKREIEDLKLSKSNSTGYERKRHDRGYTSHLTNPRQVNKLTRFFGQEPSWLEIFLTRLGYEQYVKNFHQEHIGMAELPYMTDEQLKLIGIPMGPRTRILQESQSCLNDDNFNIYIV